MTRHLNYPPMTDIANPRVEDCARGTAWSDKEIHFLRQHHRKFKNKIIGEYLRRSETAVKVMVCRLRKEDQRIAAAKEAGNVPRETQAADAR